MLTPLINQKLVIEHLPPKSWHRRPRYRLVTPIYWKEYKIPSGFVSDGASVPPALRFLFDPMGNYAKAAFIHDFLLAFVWDTKNGLSRKECDREFYAAMKSLKVPVLIRKGMYFSVRLFAILSLKR